jgi:hypothetical protein
MSNVPDQTSQPRPVGRINGALDRGWQGIELRWERMTGVIASSVLGRWWRRTENPNIADWSLLAAILGLAFVTFLYGDVRVTFEHSFNFLDSVFAGRPQDFYQIAIENSTFGHPAVYDVPIYAVFALWNLPTYLLHHFAGFDYLNSMPAQLWLKSMMVVFALIAAWLMIKIARRLGMPSARAKWVAFFFLSSMSVFMPIFVIVQYDIISVTLMLAGLLAYLNGRTRSFLLWFLAANTFKLFALFIFIPLVLLREKRLPRALAQIVVGVLGLILCRLLYRGDLAFQISTGGFTDLMLDRLSVSGFAWVGGLTVPLFIVFMVCLVIFAYAKRPASDRELHALAVYVSLAAFLAFCALVPLNPYWIALVAPFSVLIIFANPRFLTLNTLLEVALSTSLFVIYMLVGFSMYNAEIFKNLLFGRLVHPASPPRFETPAAIFAELGIADRVVYIVGFMIACVIAVLIVNYPRASFVAGMPNQERMPRSVVWVRLSVLYGISGLLFAMYLLPAPPTAYSSTTASPTRTDVNLLSDGAVIEEKMRFDKTIAVDSIQVGLDASAVTWVDSASVRLSVRDSAGTEVFTGAVAANAVGVGLATFPVKGLTLDEGRTYTLRLTGADIENEPLYAQLNPERDEFVTTENGKAVQGDLVVVIQGR